MSATKEQGASRARAKGVAVGVVLLLVALTLGLWTGSAFADTASITSGDTMSVTDCSAQRTQAGTVRLNRANNDGGAQLPNNNLVTVSGSAADGKIIISGTGNSESNNSTQVISFTTTVASDVTNGVYSAPVTLSTVKNGTVTSLQAGPVTVTVACPVPDLTAPEVSFAQSSVTAAADRVDNGVVGANVAYTVTATDDVDKNPTINCDKASGSFFAVGEHTVRCTATDNTSKTSAATLPVMVSADETSPVITLNPVGSLTVPASAQQNGVVGAVVTFVANVTDNVAPAPAATCAPLSGSFFAVGTHTVICNATDVSDNPAVPATLSITVNPDLTAPVVTIKADGPVDLEANAKEAGVPGAVVTFSATAVDAVDGALPVSCTPVSGTFFMVGDHTVQCTAQDSSKNSAAATLSIKVTMDATKPVVTFEPGEAVSVEANRKQDDVRGAVVNFTVKAVDNLDGTLTPDCDGQSGFFPVDVATVVECTATDTAGNKSDPVTLSITVTKDATAPTVTLDPAGPLNLVVNAESDGVPGRFVTFSATAADAVDGTLPASCAPVSGTFFPVGVHTVTCSATDGTGNTRSVPLSITVQADVTPPVLSLPSLGTLEATGPGGRAVSYTATATDDSTVTPVVTCVPASGSTFAIGQTTVNCDATDGSKNTATGSFTITVADGAAPNMDGPATVSKEATSPDGAAVSFSVVADDVVSGLVAVECVPASGSTFRVGAHTVECSAVDAAGNKGLHELTVTVTDSTAPAVSAPSAITTQATSAAGAVISFAATASDIVDGFLTPACTPPSGGTFPVGTTTVVCTVKDAAGNTGQASFVITVQPLAQNVPDEQPRTPAQTPVDTPPRLPEPDEPKSVPVTPRPRDETPLSPPAPAPAPLPGGETATPDVPRGVDVELVPAVPPAPAAAPAADRPALPPGGSTTGQIPSGVPATAGDQLAVTAPDEAVDGDADGQTGSVGSADDGVPDGLDAADVRAGTLVGQDGERLVEGKQGTHIRFVAGGFAPFSWVELEFHSDPISLGRARADRHGVVDVELTIAADMPEGSHHVVAFGTDASGRAREVRVGLMVLPAAAPARLPVAPVLGALAALLVLVAGARTVRLVQRRPATV